MQKGASASLILSVYKHKIDNIRKYKWRQTICV